MKLALSQVCSLNSPFPTDVEDYAAGECRYVELWLTKMETYLAGHAVNNPPRNTRDARCAMEACGIQPIAGSFQGGVLASQGESRNEAWGLFHRRLDLCRELGTDLIIMACDVKPPFDQKAIQRVENSLQQAAQEAGRRKMRVALEFQKNSVFGNNLQTAAALVAQTASPHLGLCLDAFHFFTGPSKTEDLQYLTAKNLFHVQLCDLADTPREFASDSDRILPGDGDFALAPLLRRLEAIGYQGAVSVEVMNPVLSQVSAEQFGEAAMAALRAL